MNVNYILLYCHLLWSLENFKYENYVFFTVIRICNKKMGVGAGCFQFKITKLVSLPGGQDRWPNVVSFKIFFKNIFKMYFIVFQSYVYFKTYSTFSRIFGHAVYWMSYYFHTSNVSIKWLYLENINYI